MKKIGVVLLVLAVILSVGIVYGAGKEKIVIAGSTTNQLGYVNASKAPFEAAYSEYELDISGGGTGAGMKGTLAGSVDVGMASRHLTKEEADGGLIPHIAGWDAIAVMVNKKNPVNNLTTAQLKAINTGKITNWKELGGADQKIIVITSHEGSATRKVFKEIVMNDEEYVADAIKVTTTRAEVDRVAKFEIAIGAVSTLFIDPASVKVITIDGVSPTEEAVLANKYKISRPLSLVTKGTPSKKAQAYIDFIFSATGQKLVTANFIGVAQKH